MGEAIVQPQTVIPIIFELSTWRDGQEIEAWLIEQLYENYGGNRKRKIYEMWVERRVLLPLLDGLDELGMVRQKACTEKVNEFAKNWKVVVCCRVKEFQQAGVNLLNLRGKVQLKPLSDRQIETYLSAVGKVGLWEQIRSVPEMTLLLESVVDVDNPDYDEPGLLRVPLFLSIAAQVYEKDNPLKGKVDLFDRYINRQLSMDVREGDRSRKERGKRNWSFKTTSKEPRKRYVNDFLIWLAKNLLITNQVYFIIEKIQPTDLLRKFHIRYFMIIVLVAGCGSTLTLGLIFAKFFGMQLGIIFSLIVGFFFASYFGSNRINPIEKFLFFRFKEIYKNIVEYVFRGIFLGITFAMSGVFVKVFIAFITSPEFFRACDANGFLFVLLMVIWGSFLGALVTALIPGLICGLILGILWGFLSISEELKIREMPNQGIWNSLYSAIGGILLSYPLCVSLITLADYLPMACTYFITKNSTITFDFQTSISQGLIYGNSLALLFGLCFGGGFACFQHFCLRIMLTRHHRIPWNLARFLTYCHERRLLQQIGGRYRFIHRELLEHFARMEN